MKPNSKILCYETTETTRECTKVESQDDNYYFDDTTTPRLDLNKAYDTDNKSCSVINSMPLKVPIEKLISSADDSDTEKAVDLSCCEHPLIDYSLSSSSIKIPTYVCRDSRKIKTYRETGCSKTSKFLYKLDSKTHRENWEVSQNFKLRIDLTCLNIKACHIKVTPLHSYKIIYEKMHTTFPIIVESMPIKVSEILILQFYTNNDNCFTLCLPSQLFQLLGTNNLYVPEAIQKKLSSFILNVNSYSIKLNYHPTNITWKNSKIEKQLYELGINQNYRGQITDSIIVELAFSDMNVSSAKSIYLPSINCRANQNSTKDLPRQHGYEDYPLDIENQTSFNNKHIIFSHGSSYKSVDMSRSKTLPLHLLQRNIRNKHNSLVQDSSLDAIVTRRKMASFESKIIDGSHTIDTFCIDRFGNKVVAEDSDTLSKYKTPTQAGTNRANRIIQELIHKHANRSGSMPLNTALDMSNKFSQNKSSTPINLSSIDISLNKLTSTKLKTHFSKKPSCIFCTSSKASHLPIFDVNSNLLILPHCIQPQQVKVYHPCSTCQFACKICSSIN